MKYKTRGIIIVDFDETAFVVFDLQERGRDRGRCGGGHSVRHHRDCGGPDHL